MVIRTGTIEDIRSLDIEEFDTPFSYDEYVQRFTAPHMIYVAEDKGAIVGYNACYERDGAWYCWVAGTHDDYRGQGIAQDLLDKQMKAGHNLGYDRMTLKTRNKFKEMLHFCIKNKFHIVGVVEKPNTLDNRILLERQI